MRSTPLLLLMSLGLVMTQSGPPANATSCELCAVYGNCNNTFGDLAGQFCGSFDLNGLREMCCCGVHQDCGKPAEDGQCECTVTFVTTEGPSADTTRSFWSDAFESVGFVIGIIALSTTLMVLVVFCFQIDERMNDCKRLGAWALASILNGGAWLRMRWLHWFPAEVPPSQRDSTAATFLVDGDAPSPELTTTKERPWTP
ncbi:hypothetical protein ACHHYP_20240 [Achlya hypogyna]|uniref:Secreted protein n=1 Tax=Achlya hypogyna TaxID=1202772 RepID=A0A1V9YW61_ACHHY|nr:hypothetical protein ACHHYP_20240 [Achlya hypogyna]